MATKADSQRRLEVASLRFQLGDFSQALEDLTLLVEEDPSNNKAIGLLELCEIQVAREVREKAGLFYSFDWSDGQEAERVPEDQVFASPVLQERSAQVGLVPRSQRSRRVCLDRRGFGKQQRWGLCLRESVVGLEVEDILPGIVKDCNFAEPGAAICVGDKILEVNGVRPSRHSSALAMLAEMSKEVLHLLLAPQGDHFMAPLKSSFREELFSAVIALKDSSSCIEDLGRIIEAVESHFQAEEELFDKYQLPNMKTHRSEHSRFLVTLRKTLEELSTKHEAKADLTAELQEVVESLGNLLRKNAKRRSSVKWLKIHTNAYDAPQYGTFFKDGEYIGNCTVWSGEDAKRPLKTENRTWTDAVQNELLGFSPPCLCDWLWHEERIATFRKWSGDWRSATIQLDGCTWTAEVDDVFSKGMKSEAGDVGSSEWGSEETWILNRFRRCSRTPERLLALWLKWHKKDRISEAAKRSAVSGRLGALLLGFRSWLTHAQNDIETDLNEAETATVELQMDDESDYGICKGEGAGCREDNDDVMEWRQGVQSKGKGKWKDGGQVSRKDQGKSKDNGKSGDGGGGKGKGLPSDVCKLCGCRGHWSRECPVRTLRQVAQDSALTVNTRSMLSGGSGAQQGGGVQGSPTTASTNVRRVTYFNLDKDEMPQSPM
eukprot:s738_g22.t1